MILAEVRRVQVINLVFVSARCTVAMPVASVPGSTGTGWAQSQV
jgi:hypothetical protein